MLGLAQGALVWSDLFALTVENCPAAVAVLDRDAHYLMTSGRWLADFGITEDDVIGRNHFEVVPQTSAAWKAAFERCVRGSVEQVEEERFVRADREIDWFRWELRAWRAAAGDVGGVVVFADKTTEKRRVHDELRRSEESLHLALTGARLGTWQWDLRTGELTWSAHSYAIFGMEVDSPVTFERFKNAVHPDDRALVQSALQRALETRGDYDLEFRVVWPDGSVHWTSTRGLAFYDALGQPVRMLGIAVDVTPEKEAERALSDSEERYRMLAEGMPYLLWQLDATGRLVYANRGWKRYFGRESIMLFEWGEVVHPDDLERVTQAWPSMNQGETDIAPFRLRRHDGVYRWFTCRSVPVRDAAGKLLHIIGISTDVEDLVHTQGALRMSQARLDTALRAAGMGTWVWEVESDRMVWDRALAQLLGSELDAAQTMQQLISLAIPEDRPVIERAILRALRREGDLEVEYRLPGPAGRLKWVAAKGRLETDVEGHPLRMFGACVEVTQHKRLEDDLRQAQKMEAIGQLAGGVAHDFNNLLTVILGQVGLAELSPQLPPPTRRALQAIGDAAEQAASLTAQLLAFGRRQTINPRDVLLDELVTGITSMLTRVLGEPISLVFESIDEPSWVHADPNMITQILMNLAINARDAMPDGGELLIQTRTVSAQQVPEPVAPDGASEYVCLSVQDSGEGISPAILPHIFEPFFTTKEVGRGTGLGLSTVYGIVKQHHGFITVDSELGVGSVFNVYLPKIQAQERERPVPFATPRMGRGQLVLLVEDEAGVRSVVQTILESHGYRLIVASDSQEALARFKEHAADLALLITDVVMPNGLGGCELAARLQAERPNLKIVLCSGYSAANVTKAMEGLKRSVFLQKPYRADQLLQVVGQLLSAD